MRNFWGKYDIETHNFHALTHHCADVAACFEALMLIPTIRKKMAVAANEKDLSDLLVAKLAVLVFLHDIGKIARGFQYQVGNIDPKIKPAVKGHLQPMVNLLLRGSSNSAWLSGGLNLDELDGSKVSSETTLCSLLIASLSHHGKPLFDKNDQHGSEHSVVHGSQMLSSLASSLYLTILISIIYLLA